MGAPPSTPTPQLPVHNGGWIGIAGPTAAGKTAAALALAEALQRRRGLACEIVSVDSALVYRGMDVGTAKPTATERAQVPHHGIDLVEPWEAYSAARFVTDARQAIEGIRARGHLPLLVGGTMLYFKALIDGLDDIPATDPAVRAALEADAAARGWPALHAQLRSVDPATGARLAPNDAQRIGRALEVWRMTGRPMSSFHTRAAGEPARAGGTQVAGSAADTDAVPLRLVSLEPGARSVLHERIGTRFDAMLAAGFLDEVHRLRDHPRWQAKLPAMRCVGYRQAFEALAQGLDGTALVQAVRERGAAATRQLAKRQLTWLRSLPARRVVACDAPDGQVVAAMWAAVEPWLADVAPATGAAA